MKRFYIDQDDIRSLHLTGSVLLCYTALRALCANPSNSWQGSYQRLSEESGCGSHDTAKRSVSALVERGLVKVENGSIYITQNASPITQNASPITQNALSITQNASNLESTKDIYNKDKCDITRTREEVFLFDCYKIAITEFGYLHPKMLMDEMYNFYNSHAWPDGWHNDRKTDVWRYWLGREGKIKGGRQPELTEATRPIMSTLIAAIPPQVIPRLTEVVQAVTIDEQKIRFIVRSADAESFAAWLQKIDIVRILAAYHKEISVVRE